MGHGEYGVRLTAGRCRAYAGKLVGRGGCVCVQVQLCLRRHLLSDLDQEDCFEQGRHLVDLMAGPGAAGPAGASKLNIQTIQIVKINSAHMCVTVCGTVCGHVCLRDPCTYVCMRVQVQV